MSQLERLAEEKKSRGVKKKTAQRNGAAHNYVVFRPTKEEREEIRRSSTAVNEAMDLIGTFLQDGHKFSLGFKDENSAYYAILREGGAEFDQAVCLSCWHTDMATALVGLAYGLTRRYASFPTIQVELWNDIDW